MPIIADGKQDDHTLALVGDRTSGTTSRRCTVLTSNKERSLHEFAAFGLPLEKAR